MTRRTRNRIDRTAPDGMLRCTRCLAPHPAEAFHVVKATGKPHCWCRVCLRAYSKERRDAGYYRERRRIARAAANVVAAREDRRRTLDRERKRRWLATPAGRVRCSLYRARSLLRRAADAVRAERLAGLVAIYERELSRMTQRAAS